MEILLAEDSPTQAERLRQLLQSQGHAARAAAHGRQALLLAGERKPDLVISDVVMPEMDGYELCRRIKADPRLRGTPVMLLTSLSDPEDVLKALECGADSFISKPYEDAYLLARIQYIQENTGTRRAVEREEKLEILFDGAKHWINTTVTRTFNLLLSSFAAAMQRNGELQRAERELKKLNDRLEQMVQERTAELSKEIEERRRAEDNLRQQFYWTTVLNSLSNAVTQRNNVESILRVVMHHLEDGFTFELGEIGLRGEDGKRPIISALSRKGSALAAQMGLKEGGEFPEDQERLADALPANRGTVLDFRQLDPARLSDETLFLLRSLQEAGIGSMLVIPMAVGNTRYGGIFLFFRGMVAFNEYQLSFLHGMAEHISIAVHNWRLYEDLEKAYGKLKRTQEAVMEQERLNAMGQMASGIAHDINNTLAPITLYTEALLESEAGLSKRGRRFLKIIQQAARDIESTTLRLRKFYRKTDDRRGLQPIDIQGLLAQVLELTRPRWQAIPQRKGTVVDLQVETEPHLPPLLGEESELREALINLVFNAVDALPQGGAIRLRARAKDSYLILEVADDGIGMNEEQKKRCLEPFYTTKGEQGTGLGLSIVYGAVQRHRGELEIESGPGAGTTVRLRFPLDAEAIRAPEPDGASARLPALRILCIDDDATVLQSLQDALEIDGHLVTAANGGAAALELFRAQAAQGQVFDLVITDLGMPYMDGYEVARQIKELSSRTPIILLSGWGKLEYVNGERPENIDRVLGKPPRIAELRSAIQKLLEGNV